MIILNRSSTRVVGAVLSAARDSLKGGEHDGRCIYEADAFDNTVCRLHRETLERRQRRLRDAIDAWDALP